MGLKGRYGLGPLGWAGEVQGVIGLVWRRDRVWWIGVWYLNSYP